MRTDPLPWRAEDDGAGAHFGGRATREVVGETLAQRAKKGR